MGNQARRLDPYLLLLPHSAHCLRRYCYPPDGHSRKNEWNNISYGLGEEVCLNLTDFKNLIFEKYFWGVQINFFKVYTSYH